MARSSADFPYVNHMNVKYGPLELIDVQRLADICTDSWYNQTLCRVNDSVVRLGVMMGEYHWHQHDDDDEFFFVVEGGMEIDLEGGAISLGPRQAVVVPKGVQHRPRVPERSVVLMVETKSIVPTGEGSGSSTRDGIG